MTTLTGSAFLALAAARGRLSLAEAWAAAHVDEDWQIAAGASTWRPPSAASGAGPEMQSAGRFLELLGDSKRRAFERLFPREQPRPAAAPLRSDSALLDAWSIPCLASLTSRLSSSSLRRCRWLSGPANTLEPRHLRLHGRCPSPSWRSGRAPCLAPSPGDAHATALHLRPRPEFRRRRAHAFSSSPT